MTKIWNLESNSRCKKNLSGQVCWCTEAQRMDPHPPDWRLTTALLCCYGLFKEIRPSEPFLTEYLIRWVLLITLRSYNEVKLLLQQPHGCDGGPGVPRRVPGAYPIHSIYVSVSTYLKQIQVWTYAYLAILVLVFLLTDLAKYKPVIVLEGFAYIATWVTYLQYLYNIYIQGGPKKRVISKTWP